jgi:hypothetical protein
MSGHVRKISLVKSRNGEAKKTKRALRLGSKRRQQFFAVFAIFALFASLHFSS